MEQEEVLVVVRDQDAVGTRGEQQLLFVARAAQTDCNCDGNVMPVGLEKWQELTRCVIVEMEIRHCAQTMFAARRLSMIALWRRY